VDVNRLVAISPTRAHDFEALGLVYSISKDYDRAIADYNKRIELDPKWVTAYAARGNAYKSKTD
jgi:lipoprotein NlpI